jgi:adenylate cyclase
MTTRRLAAILAADVAGFSAMMERDEEGTATRVLASRIEVIEPALAGHHGWLVKTTGDGFLAEFASPVEAVPSVSPFRISLPRHSSTPTRSSLRIGINLGHIIIEDDGDVLGTA